MTGLAYGKVKKTRQFDSQEYERNALPNFKTQADYVIPRKNAITTLNNFFLSLTDGPICLFFQ